MIESGNPLKGDRIFPIFCNFALLMHYSYEVLQGEFSDCGS
jgi:hypothetical protein